jgi:hypothetical protein
VFETFYGGIMKRLIVVISILLLLISGCTDEYTPAAPEVTPEYTLTINGLPVVLTAIGGTERQLTFTVQVTDENHRPAPDVMVNLVLVAGEGSFASPEVTTDTSGFAEATCTFLIPVGESSLCIVASAGASSAQYTIQVHGSLLNLELTQDVFFIFADNGRTVANLVVVLKDENSQALQGEEIRFTCEYGAVSPEMCLTDSLGMVHAVFTDVGVPSVNEKGELVPARIRAEHVNSEIWAECGVTILPIEPVVRIVIEPFPIPGRFQVGSIDAIYISVSCFNEDGSAVPGSDVNFAAEMGRFGSEKVETDINGRASNFFYPPTVACVEHLTIWVQNPNSSIVSAELELEFIPGPPYAIGIDFDTEGEDEGGAVWSIEVCASVFDRYGNPVEDGIPVDFSCDSVATIGEATTGNQSRRGNSEQGVAYALMDYNSRNTFDTLTVEARVHTEDGEITARRSLILPLQGGQLMLQVQPDSFDFEGFEGETANFMC